MIATSTGDRICSGWRQKERDIAELHIAYFGSNVLCAGALPKRTYWLQPAEPTRGWIAISEMLLKGVIVYSVPRDGVCDYSRLTQPSAVPRPYAWLERYRPVQLVGKSIRLYYIP